MREIKSTDYTVIKVIDERGPGNANHIYDVLIKDCNEEIYPSLLQRVEFQNGPIKEHGVTGVQNEDILTIVVDRLEGFQSGDFACVENAQALQHVKSAVEILNKRTADRKNRGVEGKNIK